MAARMRPQVVRLLAAMLAGVVLAVAAFLAWRAWHVVTEDYVVTRADDGSAVTQLVTARLSGASQLKVATLSGTIQSTATDVRGFGLLRSDQLVKMPYAVDYFVDAGAIGAGSVRWSADTRTLLVDAPDVTVARPNVDEAARTLVQTRGLYVSRTAAEELSRRVSANAQGRAGTEARSPERMAQAREMARTALQRLLGAPLAAQGLGDARVVVTFPAERGSRNGERWDVTAPVGEVLSNAR